MKSIRILPQAILSIIGLLTGLSAHPATVDTIQVYSEKMSRKLPCVVIAPDKQADGTRCPVLYLLHGYNAKGTTDSHKGWLTDIAPSLPRLADQYGMMIVCPNGENSWYWDSPRKKNSQFETFISQELTDYIDRHYNTLACRQGRAVTGASMGGHGALWTAIRHQDVFGAAGSMSGGVDFRPFPDKWGIGQLLGEDLQEWGKYTVTSLTDNLTDGKLALIIDCGYGDFFFQSNEELHRKLLERKIGHDYLIRPGGHTFQYWNNAIEYQLLFFYRYFTRNEPERHPRN